MNCAPFAYRRGNLENGKDSYTLRPPRRYGNWQWTQNVRIQSHLDPAMTLIDSNRMKASEFGKRLGIGVRVAGRVAHQHAQQRAAAASHQPASAAAAQPSAPPVLPSAAEIHAIKQQARQKTHKITRAAGRGVGGFLRPFSRVGGILWLEITGAFFALFALFFAQDLWRTHLNYAQGPLHQRFLLSAALTALFAYLSASSFWRARRK